VLGNKDLAVRSLDVLVRHGADVVGAVLNPDDDGRVQDRWYQSLKRAAAARGIPAIQPSTVSSDEGESFIARLRPDLLLSLSYAKIIRPRILQLAGLLPVNIHFARLPWYRGCLPLVHAMCNGDASVGVTVHVMDAGIDTGDILAQIDVPLSDQDTAYSTYFKCVDAGEQLLDRALPLLFAGRLAWTPQDLAAGSYHPQVYPNDRWSEPSHSPVRLSSFIRGLTFPSYPTARAMVKGQEHELRYQDGWFSAPTLHIGPTTIESLHEHLSLQDWRSVCPA